MIAQYLLALFGAVLLWRGLVVVVAMGPKTNHPVRLSWLLETLGGFGLALAPFCMTTIPLIPVILVLAGESGLAIFSRRAVLP